MYDSRVECGCARVDAIGTFLLPAYGNQRHVHFPCHISTRIRGFLRLHMF